MINTISRIFHNFDSAQSYATGYDSINQNDSNITVIQEDELTTRVTITPRTDSTLSETDSDITNGLIEMNDIAGDMFTDLNSRVESLEADKEAREKANSKVIEVLKSFELRLAGLEAFEQAVKARDESIAKAQATAREVVEKDMNEWRKAILLLKSEEQKLLKAIHIN